LGDPGNYISPDVVVSFLGLDLEEEGENRVRLRGAIGKPATEFYKVSATYQRGYKAEGMLALFGRDLRKKAQKSGEIIFSRLKNRGIVFEKIHMECIGTGDLVPGTVPNREPLEGILRLAVIDPNRLAV